MLDRLIKIGFENLTPERRAVLVKGLAEAKAFRAHFEPRLNSLLARQKAHLEHEKDLMKRLKELNMIAPPPSQFSTN